MKEYKKVYEASSLRFVLLQKNERKNSERDEVFSWRNFRVDEA